MKLNFLHYLLFLSLAIGMRMTEGHSLRKASNNKNLETVKTSGHQRSGCYGNACGRRTKRYYSSKAPKSHGYKLSKAPRSGGSKSKKKKGSKSKGAKNSNYASQCTSGYGCCAVNLASDATGSCVPGTKVEFKTADQTTVIDSCTVSSASQCSCMFAYGQQPAEHYCINLVPTFGNECDGSCVTYLTTDTFSSITYVNTQVVTTTTTTTSTTSTTNYGTQTSNSAISASTTGSVSVRLFIDHNKNTIQETTEENLTGLEIKLIDTNLVEQTIVSTCKDDVFLHVKPGTYTVMSQMAQGYACDCSKTVTVVAGEESVVILPFS